MPRKPPNRAEFQQLQYAFAAHIRDPRQHPCPPDVEARRMAVYRELFYNNVESFMAGSFPVLRQLFDDARWHALIQDYFARHRAHTPLFPEMPREFLQYLELEREPRADDPPFLLELAHYEWVELALSLSDQEADLQDIDPAGDLLHGRPVLSPLAWPLSYRFPVHRIGPDLQPQHAPAQASYLLVYRDLDDQVRFIELNPVTARLLQLIRESGDMSGQQMLEHIGNELGHPDPAVVVDGGLAVMEDLRARGAILGTRRAG